MKSLVGLKRWFWRGDLMLERGVWEELEVEDVMEIDG